MKKIVNPEAVLIFPLLLISHPPETGAIGNSGKGPPTQRFLIHEKSHNPAKETSLLAIGVLIEHTLKVSPAVLYTGGLLSLQEWLLNRLFPKFWGVGAGISTTNSP